ncbi:MAG: Xaa-Pro peptidase family protein [Candidatus Marinimicrobia bacterium]|nr:Xaa-Pro peptidase family protein [Candidatus Neomarinimicrobiota bacterium]
MTYSHRRQKVINLIAELDLDALIFCQPENIRYLCGFSGSDGVLVVTSDQLVFLTDSRYTTQAHEEVSADCIEEYKIKAEGVIAQLQASIVTRVGFEADLAFGIVNEFQEKGDPSWLWLHLKDELQVLRMHKSTDEINSLVNAANLNVLGLDEVETLIRPGVRESEIALALEFALRKLGAEEKAFDIIVASGLRGAMPHGIASDKVLSEGELVTIDFGCRLSGYHSDETVTFALGKVSDELRTIYDTVLEAHDCALAAVAPGVALNELDRLARDHIGSCGYGDYFGHGLGHGVGLEVHEAPVVSPRSKAVAEEGMVFTVEPGIYVPGVGGVRIEDMVLVTADGHQILTKIPKMFRNILLN